MRGGQLKIIISGVSSGGCDAGRRRGGAGRGGGSGGCIEQTKT